jgi:uncharacterized membrane protein
VLMGLVLGFFGIGILVFFIHHIATRIQASQILDAVHRETIEAIDRHFPHALDASREEGSGCGHADGHVHVVCARRSGYLQQVDFPRLARLMRECDGSVSIDRPIGDFVIEGDPVASIHLRELDSRRMARLVDQAHASWSLGVQRTLEQDIAFGLRQLVDVALKALSPSINDSTTATMCIDHLTALLVRLSDRHLHYGDCSERGVLRVMPRHPDFNDLVTFAFAQIIEHVRGNIAVLEQLLGCLQRVDARTRDPSRRQALRLHVARILRSLPEVEDEHARRRLQSRAEALLATA